MVSDEVINLKFDEIAVEKKKKSSNTTAKPGKERRPKRVGVV